MNIQNLPRHDTDNTDAAIIHRIFKPKLDALIFFDWVSMEMVVLAYYLSKALGDNILRDRITAGIDVHEATAKDSIGDVQTFYGVPRRNVGKKINFSLIYGGGAPTISEQLGIPESGARKAVNGYHKSNPGIRNLQAALEASYDRKRYVKTLYGRPLRSDSPHKLINVLIQGSCAEIMKRSLVKIHRDLGRNPRRAHLVGAFHDEFAIDAREKDIERVTMVVPQLMRDMKIERILPLKSDCEITNTDWSEKREYHDG